MNEIYHARSSDVLSEDAFFLTVNLLFNYVSRIKIILGNHPTFLGETHYIQDNPLLSYLVICFLLACSTDICHCC